MPSRRKPTIARAFDRARDYDAHAHVQRAAARRLAQLIAALPLPADPPILEIGCGTGFLSRELAGAAPGARLILSDLSEAMVSRTKAMLGNAEARYLVMDGERPPIAAGEHFALICSSLAFQWFDDIGRAIGGLFDLLAPGGHLAFSTLAAGTFAEWRAAHQQAGFEAATRDYPTLDELRAMCPAGALIDVERQTLTEGHRDGISFLRALKAIGAHTPWEPRAPLPPGSMRRVLRAFETSGASATYQVAHVVISKAPEGL